MRDLASNYRDLCIETLVALVICICVGVLAYGYGVFDIHDHKFVFVGEGFTGAFAFYSLRRLRVRDTLLFLCIAFFLQVGLLTKTRGALWIFLEFVFFVPIPVASAVLFSSYRKHVNEVRLYDAIMLGVFCAALVSIARGISYATTPLQTGVTSWPPVVPFSLAETVESFLIGLGLGLGFRVIDLQEVKHHLHLTKGFTTRAALPEAKKRGLQLNEISKLLHALAAKPRQPTKASPPQDRWGTGQHVTDEAAPILYSKRAIYTFTFFFSVIFGAGLMVINLRTLRRPEGVVPTVSFSIGFLATVFLVLDYLQSSSGTITSPGYLVSYLGSWLILKLIWDKYIGKDQKYRKRSVFFPLLVGIALIVGYLFFVTRFSTHV